MKPNNLILSYGFIAEQVKPYLPLSTLSSKAVSKQSLQKSSHDCLYEHIRRWRYCKCHGTTQTVLMSSAAASHILLIHSASCAARSRSGLLSVSSRARHCENKYLIRVRDHSPKFNKVHTRQTTRDHDPRRTDRSSPLV